MRGLLRQVAKVVIKEGFRSGAICPGEENCLKFKTAASERECEACPRSMSRTKLYSIEGVEAVLPWLNHLFYLYSLVKVGASFHVNDLTRKEWDGLLMLEAVRAEVENDKIESERLKQKAESAIAKSRRR